LEHVHIRNIVVVENNSYDNLQLIYKY